MFNNTTTKQTNMYVFFNNINQHILKLLQDYSYPHSVETGGSTSCWSHAGMLVLGVQSKRNRGSTEKLLIGQRHSHC